MARKSQLRSQRAGTVINLTSRKQETRLGKALAGVVDDITVEFGLKLRHESSWRLCDIVARLQAAFPDVAFECVHDTTFMRPDGGILSLAAKSDAELYPILITEVKNQGTNDLRASEGLSKQAMGNAIERLGKNVIGFRTALRNEHITPLICFGDGCDFARASTILDRVTTIAMFGPLNHTAVVNAGPNELFNRGSFYFREKPWTMEEMKSIMVDVCKRSIHYYLARYGDDHFARLGDDE